MRPKRKNPLGMETVAYFLERGMKKNRPRRNSAKPRGNFKVCKASTSRGNTGKVQKFYIRLNAGKRRNPEDTAAERYEYFHGRAATVDTTVETKIHQHEVLSGIGKLLKLEILAINGEKKVWLEGFKGALLAQDEKGRQLYIVGGDQSVNLKDFGITQKHELEILGALTCVVYHTRKDHLRPEDGGTAAYDHKFGREGHVRRVEAGELAYLFGKNGARLPFVGYDVRNKLLSIQGGGYELPAEGIDG